MKELIDTIEGNYQRYDQLLTQLESKTPQSLYGLTPAKVREMIHRLAEIQSEVVDFRLKKILSEEHPYLPQIRTDKLQHGPVHDTASLPQLVDIFLRQRQDLLNLLNSLPSENWERTGVHEKEGHVSFKEFVRRMAVKDQESISELDTIIHDTHE